MAFIKRTWLARIGIGLNKFIIGSPDSQGRQTLTSSPDSISQEGDVISAENLNDLEDRIETGFNGKQDTLTFDNAPTDESSNPVTSGGIYTALEGKQDTLTFDSVPTQDSLNPVTSGGIYSAIENSQFVIEDKERNTSGSVTVGNHTTSISAPKTGYTLLGVLGFSISFGSGTEYYGITGVRISGTTIYIDYSINYSDSSSASIHASAIAIYKKN